MADPDALVRISRWEAKLLRPASDIGYVQPGSPWVSVCQKVSTPVSSIVIATEDRDPLAAVARAAWPSWRAALGSVLTRSTRVGLVGGLACGWLLAAATGWQYRSLMGLRQWTDVLSYSGLAHGILWTAHGAIAGAACAAAMLVSRRVRRFVAAGPMSVAILVAGISVLMSWTTLATVGLAMAVGIQRVWTAVMVVLWLIVLGMTYAVAYGLSRTRVGRWSSAVGRIGFWPAAAMLVLCSVVQWVERPKLLAHPTDWIPSATVAPRRGDGRPNVVLVVLDTQRADRLGCYGYERPTTPRLNAFAQDAHVWENCMSTAVWTLPSHASIFTGLFPSEHGTGRHHRWLDDAFVTMAELLDQAGYQTVAFSNNLYISDVCNLSQGFDQVVHPFELHGPRGNSVSAFVGRVLQPAGRVGQSLGALTNEDAGGKFTGQLVARWLDRRDRSAPFFLFVNLMEAHYPYRPHLPHRRVFIKAGDIDLSYRHDWDSAIPFSLLKRDCHTASELALLNRTYDAEARMLDDYVARLIEMLAAHTSLDDTLLIITADHGENLGDHHLMDHQWCVYDTLAHVPLIMRYPRRLAPGRTSDLVQSVDLLPTVMDAVYARPVPTPSTFGRSLLTPLATTDLASASGPEPALTGRVVVVERMSPADPPLATAQRINCQFDRTPHLGVLRAVRQGPWKYIVAADGRAELYHVINDPGEGDNLIEAHRPIAEQLASRLQHWLATANAYQGPKQQQAGKRFDEEARRRLRDLGYVH